MTVSVPGIEDLSDGSSQASGGMSNPVTPASAKRKDQATVGEEAPKGKKKRGANNDASDNKPRPKASAASKQNRELESRGKELLCIITRASQIIDRVVQECDRLPSEWAWAKPLLQDYHERQNDFHSNLTPTNGDDISEFVNQLKLGVFTPSVIKDMKKAYKENFYGMLTLFIDRCASSCEQTLA